MASELPFGDSTVGRDLVCCRGSKMGNFWMGGAWETPILAQRTCENGVASKFSKFDSVFLKSKLGGFGEEEEENKHHGKKLVLSSRGRPDNIWFFREIAAPFVFLAIVYLFCRISYSILLQTLFASPRVKAEETICHCRLLSFHSPCFSRIRCKFSTPLLLLDLDSSCEKKRKMNCFQCCMSEEKANRKSLKKSIKEYHDTKTLASFANISFKSDSSRRRYITEEIKKLGKGNISAQIFTFRELCAATNNFTHDNQLGEGGFGRVYKGIMENTNQVVAVKQLDRNGFQGNREFLVEVLMLSLLHHPNLVNLVGYCADGDQRILVYEYMAKGSLEDHLLDIAADKPPLDWSTRMKIAEGAAKGLEYLHETANPPVIYRDFKASNILLDEEFNPKLSDFGLAKLGPTGDKSHVSTRVMGTYGYCAPEYALTGQLTTKSDVYSFGVVFLEIITGRRVIDNARPTAEQNLITWAQPLFKDRRKFTLMADPKMEGNYPVKALYQALAVAAMCLQEEANTRPLISDVVTAIEYLAVNKDMNAEVDDESDAEAGSESDSGSVSPDRSSKNGDNVEGDGR